MADAKPKTIDDFLAVMAALRTPVTGCPWDLEQTFQTIAPYTIEEAYEVADAIARADLVDLKEELGDLLLQVVYHARLAEEQRAFAFADVVDGIATKMIRRHPHVFGEVTAGTTELAIGWWEKIKAEEKAAKGALRAAGSPQGSCTEQIRSVLDDVPIGMAALTRAVKLQDKAARVGFDWPSLAPVLDKLKEELAELEEVLGAQNQSPIPLPNAPGGRRAAGVSPGAIEEEQAELDEAVARAPSHAPGGRRAEGVSPGAIEEEFGDLMFVMANVARHLKLDPEAALRRANDKFTRRFHYIEARLAERGKTPAGSTLDEMDAIWNEIRASDKEAQ